MPGRDRARRLRDIGEARIAIDSPEEELPRKPVPSRLWPLALAAVLGTVAVVGWWPSHDQAGGRPLMRLNVELGPDMALARKDPQGGLAISPDGRRLAFRVRGADGQIRLATRLLDRGEVTTLPGTEGVSVPFFSPDGEWIGFYAAGKVKKIASQGGAPSRCATRRSAF